MISQSHLDEKQTVDLGSFYTPTFIVEIVYDMVLKQILNQNFDIRDFILLDTSCGYGNFLKTPLDFDKKIGADIDKKAIEIAKDNFKNFKKSPLFLVGNSLFNLKREKFNIKESDKIIIVGNPPYNDKTSIIKSHIKNQDFDLVDIDLKHRDLGISFLLSFAHLCADFICILHPLSYLIKESNFKSMKKFYKNYILVDSLIISSEVFCPNSLSFFPILIALYKRDNEGMDFDYIKNHTFKTIENKSFRLNDFDFISNYIDKYPNKNKVLSSQKVAMFYTMRDINALRRSKTFITKDCNNAVYIPKSKYSLYCFVDVFKQIISHIPYYFGNCDVMIDYDGFLKLEDEFIKSSQTKILNSKVMDYFKNLLRDHYED
ncbi:SAM-dependent methyltransferase [Helicobacter sp. 13S00477-4]|uniref:SAM-dependent methyltransferase n=1 Tax=Helicobacter sp. 13S00477-4 TaxID=1905759 RepID=UPI000BA5A41F|nr:SAM-dependent methyltransferase [Helicobacter sp. 13S00477-4]PAF52400.1 hypothetical protein BKH44_02420 [Helicobacter sp. 13S00477-4]